MTVARRTRAAGLTLGACGLAVALTAGVGRAEEPAHPASLDEAIVRAAARHGVPESLVRRIVMRESKYNPRARNHAYWGLMQISYPTARSMGFHGSPQELLNPVVNLRYAVPYLANAFVIAGRRQEEAVRLYAAGYYNTARNRGLVGALRTADSAPLSGVPDEPDVLATAAPAPAPEPEPSIFGSLFGPSEMPRDATTQQVVYASAAPAAAQPAAMPAGKSGDEVALVADKHGDLQPPKAWRRDGGTTVIARGEQGIEEIAAAKGVEATAAGRHRHARKSTEFASLDAPASAQAYAAAPGQMQADSQAAIAQATAGQATAGQPQAGASPAATAKPEVVADDTTARKARRKHARRGRHHDDDTQTAAAGATPPAGQPPVLSSDQQAAAAPEAQPAAAQVADAAQAPQDAGAAAQAQFEQSSGGAAPSPARKPKRHARRSRGHKTTEVAAQAPDDGQAQQQPAPAPPAQ